jgi:hypothetical protein
MFHFTIGEMTVTLQDTSLLMGLPCEGEPLGGCRHLRRVAYGVTRSVRERSSELLRSRPVPGVRERSRTHLDLAVAV